MFKVLILAIVIIGSVTLTDKEILQQTLNGAFEQNKLPDPVTILPCIDDKSAHQIVVFGGQILDKAARGSVTDLVSIIQLVKDFGNQLDPAVGQCLDGNKQFQALGLKYGIDNTTDSATIEKKIAVYITLHYATVHKWAQQLDDDWHAGKFYQVGFNAATDAHSIFKAASKVPNPTDKEILQQTLNGAFEQNKLPDPVTILPCIDDKSAHQIVVFGGQILDKAARGSVTDLVSIIQLVKDFGNQLDPAVGQCLDGNKQFQALGLKYGIDNTTDSATIEKKIAVYITLHYATVHKWAQQLDDDWHAGKFYQVGFNAATDAHSIFKAASKVPNPTDKEILQQTLNGAFEQNKLPDPVTILPCIDDKSAHQIVVFGGQILDKAARGSVTDLVSIIQLVKDFGNQLDPAVGQCLDGNKQFQALGLKYGIDNTTDSATIEKKIAVYITLHYATVHKWAQQLDDDWHAGKFYQVGFNAATDAHSIFKAASKVPNPTDKEILQLFLNGLFQQNKLPDTITVIPCFDDASAKQTVVFIGSILDKAAKGSISDYKAISDQVKKFGHDLDPAVKDCLDGNQQFKSLGLKYGIDDQTDTSALEKKIVAYITLHYLTVHKWLQGLDNDWHAGKYYQVGWNGATYGHNIIKLTPQEIRRLVQQQ